MPVGRYVCFQFLFLNDHHIALDNQVKMRKLTWVEQGSNSQSKVIIATIMTKIVTII